jgi:hypothetical protein
MSFRQCLDCGEYLYTNYHKCSPAWLVWQLDDPERFDVRTVYGIDAQEAAEKWADREDSLGDYWIVQGGNPIVCVQRADDDEAPIEYLAVEGESVPQYHAAEMTLDSFKRELRSLVRSHRFYEAGRLYGQMHEIDFHTRSEPA